MNTQKILKLSGHKGFFFPKKDRFNEDAAEEVQSQRAGPTRKMSGMEKAGTPMYLKKGLEGSNDEYGMKNNRSPPGKKGQLQEFFSSRKDYDD